MTLLKPLNLALLVAFCFSFFFINKDRFYSPPSKSLEREIDYLDSLNEDRVQNEGDNYIHEEADPPIALVEQSRSEYRAASSEVIETTNFKEKLLVELPPYSFVGGGYWGTGQIDRIIYFNNNREEYSYVDASKTNKTTAFAYLISNNNYYLDLKHFGLNPGDNLEVSMDVMAFNSPMLVGVKVHFLNNSNSDSDTGEDYVYRFYKKSWVSENFNFKIPKDAIKFKVVLIVEKNKSAVGIDRVRIASNLEYPRRYTTELGDYRVDIQLQNLSRDKFYCYYVDPRGYLWYEGTVDVGFVKQLFPTIGGYWVLKDLNGKSISHLKIDKDHDDKALRVDPNGNIEVYDHLE